MKAPEMKKTPSALKWLAEKRARIAGELRSAEQVCQRILEDVDELRQGVATLECLLASAELRQQRISKELAALDQVVVLYDEGIKPELIEPINAWQGNYGKRGALREFLLETIKGRAPDYVSTKELEVLTISKFSLVFELRALQAVWYVSAMDFSIALMNEDNKCKFLATWRLSQNASRAKRVAKGISNSDWLRASGASIRPLLGTPCG